MNRNSPFRLWVPVVAALLAVALTGPIAQAGNGESRSEYYVTVNKGCGVSGPGCGNLSVFREQTRSGNKVQVALYHWECLGFRGSPYKFRWLVSPVVRTSGNRFFVKVDRPRLKMKVRGRFIGPTGSSEVKGTVSFRNLNRNCGFRNQNFRKRETGPTTDPQG